MERKRGKKWNPQKHDDINRDDDHIRREKKNENKLIQKKVRVTLEKSAMEGPVQSHRPASLRAPHVLW